MRESENGANGAVDDETSESDPEGEGGEVGNTHRTLTIQNYKYHSKYSEDYLLVTQH